MQLGIDTNSFRLATGLFDFRASRPMRLTDIIRVAGELGLAGVHVANVRLLESRDDAYLSDVRQMAQQQGLYLELGIHGTDVDELREGMHIASRLGCGIVRTFVGADRGQGWAAWRQQLDRAVEGLKQTVPLAQEMGVVVAIENHGDLTSPEIVSLLDKVGSDQVGVCLDTGKSLLVVEDPLLAAQNLLPYVVTACLSDYRLVSTPRGAAIVGCALGQGVVDLLAIVQLLRQRTPDLHLNVESPVIRWELPFLEDKFWDAFYDRTPQDLAAILRLIRKNALDPNADYRTPYERGEVEELVLQYEDDMFRRSIAYAKQVLLAG